jgi:4-amino-4-deoxy-L-arabinose transferase-like glycosyltransferase
MATNGTQSDRRLKLLWWAVVVASALIFLARPGAHNFLDPDEGRYAEIPREMLESGDFLTPTLDYVKYFEKPPLFYWMVAGSMAVFGEKERAARLVVGLAALATVLVTVGFGARILRRRTAVLGGWIYATGLVPLALGRLLTLDGPFSLFLASSWAAWYLGYAAPPGRAKRGWMVLSWVCLGLATMTKGPVAILLSALLVIAFVVLRRDWAALRATFGAAGLLAFAVVTVPWYVMVSLRNPEFAHFFFFVQHFQRFTGSSAEHVKSFFFFFPILPAGLGAWALIGVAALVKGVRDGVGGIRLFRRDPPAEEREATDAAGAAPGAILFLFLWTAIVVGFFSCSACKLITYILPAYPALALLVAWYLDTGGIGRPFARWSTAAMGLVLLALVAVLPRYALKQDQVPFDQVTPFVLAMQAVLALGGVLLAACAWRPRLTKVAAGAVLAMTLPVLLSAVPVIAKYRRTGVMLKALNPLPAQVRVAEWGDYNQSMSFYLKRRTVLVDVVDELTFGSMVGNQSAWFLKGRDSLARLAADGPLMVCLRTEDWPRLHEMGIFHPVGGNSSNVLAGNATFFKLTGLKPWPDEAVTAPPLLLMPRKS